MSQKQIGIITNNSSNLKMAKIKLSGTLTRGDRLQIKGKITDIEVTVERIHISKKELHRARSGEEVEIRVPEKVRDGDVVFLMGEMN